MNDVVMRCPRCKERVVITFEEWVESSLEVNMKRVRCDNVLCDKTVMLYHKDVIPSAEHAQLQT